jgi:hypothetical protein
LKRNRTTLLSLFALPLALAPLACSRGDGASKSTSASASASVAPSSAAAASGSNATGAAAGSTEPALSGVTGIARKAPAAAGLCDLHWGFHGKVAGQDAFLRLARADDADAVVGRYFYAKHGLDLALRGTLSAALELELVEGDAKKPTGRFKGTCDPKTGALDGTWNGGKDDAPFHFDRIASRDKPLVATKKLTLARKAKTKAAPGGPPGAGTCEYEQKTFELFGAGTPEAERALNQQDARTLKPRVLSKEVYGQVEVCDEGINASFSEGVVATFHGLATLEAGGTFMAAGAAHPANAVDYARRTVDLTTGRVVTEKDLFAAFPKAMVERCVAAYVKANDMEDFSSHIDGHSFDLTPVGIHVFGADYPHVAAALTGAGPTLTWGALLRDHALRADSPVKRAWDGIAPAAAGAGAADCVGGDALPK